MRVREEKAVSGVLVLKMRCSDCKNKIKNSGRIWIGRNNRVYRLCKKCDAKEMKRSKEK